MPAESAPARRSAGSPRQWLPTEVNDAFRNPPRLGKKVSKKFFFEKKNQKTFIHEVRDSTDKSFLFLFYKKEGLASLKHTQSV
jgi:hypothetical protein